MHQSDNRLSYSLFTSHRNNTIHPDPTASYLLLLWRPATCTWQPPYSLHPTAWWFWKLERTQQVAHKVMQCNVSQIHISALRGCVSRLEKIHPITSKYGIRQIHYSWLKMWVAKVVLGTFYRVKGRILSELHCRNSFFALQSERLCFCTGMYNR